MKGRVFLEQEFKAPGPAADTRGRHIGASRANGGAETLELNCSLSGVRPSLTPG